MASTPPSARGGSSARPKPEPRNRDIYLSIAYWTNRVAQVGGWLSGPAAPPKMGATRAEASKQGSRILASPRLQVGCFPSHTRRYAYLAPSEPKTRRQGEECSFVFLRLLPAKCPHRLQISRTELLSEKGAICRLCPRGSLTRSARLGARPGHLPLGGKVDLLVVMQLRHAHLRET